MKIKLLLPVIRTSELSYETTSSSLTMVLGFISNHTNVADDQYPVSIYLKEVLSDQIVLHDNITVTLNSFSTAYTVTGLQTEKLYVFMIDSGYQQVTSTVISTMTNTQSIQVVGREHVFSSNVRYYGNSIELLEDRTVDFRKGLDLINETTGTSIIVDNGQVYAFCPTHLLTTKYHYPSILGYGPLVGLPSRGITIHKIPTITKLTSMRYRITPPSMMRVVNVGAGIDQTTGTAVSEIDLSSYGVGASKTSLRPVF